MPGRGGGPSFAEAVREAMARWDLEVDSQAAIVVDLPQELGYAALAAVAAAIVAFHDAGHRNRPLVLVLQQDYAQVLGQTIQAIRPGLPLLVVDQVVSAKAISSTSGYPSSTGARSRSPLRRWSSMTERPEFTEHLEPDPGGTPQCS